MNCPACDHPTSEFVDAVFAEDIWESYRSEFGLDFPRHVIDMHTPSESIDLRECINCHLQFFTPAVPGGVEYYERLSQSVDYENRWEFGVALQHLDGSELIVDVGCGSGRFLVRARHRGCSVIGIDHNPAALASLATEGIEHYSTIQEYLETRSGRADVVTAFQLLEHLPDPAQLLKDIAGCLRADGQLFIAVPNRLRSGRRPLEPLDHPPHHLTRWDTSSLRLWGVRGHMELIETRFEPPDLPTARSAFRETISQKSARILPTSIADFAGRAAGWVITRHPTFRLLSRADAFTRFGVYGHTIVARFRPVQG